MIKVLFLDIDGVLNTDRQHWHCQMNGITPVDEFGYEFDHKAVVNLATILEETDAEIVISSSWKFLGLQTLQKMWKDRNLPGTILDITPDGKTAMMRPVAVVDAVVGFLSYVNVCTAYRTFGDTRLQGNAPSTIQYQG